MRLTSFLLPVCHSLFAAAQNQTDPATLSQCLNAEIYQHPNASGTFPVPAVDIVPNSGPSVTLASSKSANWTVTNVLGQSSNPYGGTPGPVLRQALFLDTSSTMKNSSSADEIGLAGCVFMFELQKDTEGKDDDGDCTSVLSSACVQDFTQLAAAAAQSVAQSGGQGAGHNLNNSEACIQIAGAIRKPPSSCSKFNFGDGGVGYALIALNLDPPSPIQNTNCSTPPIPPYFLSSYVPYPNAKNYTTYDQLVRTVAPTLLTVFSNSTSGINFSKPFGDAHLVCSTPKNVQAGSRVPAKTGGAVHVYGAVDIRQLVWWALAVNTFIFTML